MSHNDRGQLMDWSGGKVIPHRTLMGSGYYAPNVIVDIVDMPGFNLAALTTAEAVEQAESVTRRRVFVGTPRRHPGRFNESLSTVCCEEHGAMLCVAKNEQGRIWRCPTCNEGAYEPADRP